MLRGLLSPKLDEDSCEEPDPAPVPWIGAARNVGVHVVDHGYKVARYDDGEEIKGAPGQRFAAATPRAALGRTAVRRTGKSQLEK